VPVFQPSRISPQAHWKKLIELEEEIRSKTVPCSLTRAELFKSTEWRAAPGCDNISNMARRLEFKNDAFVNQIHGLIVKSLPNKLVVLSRKGRNIAYRYKWRCRERKCPDHPKGSFTNGMTFVQLEESEPESCEHGQCNLYRSKGPNYTTSMKVIFKSGEKVYGKAENLRRRLQFLEDASGP